MQGVSVRTDKKTDKKTLFAHIWGERAVVSPFDAQLLELRSTPKSGGSSISLRRNEAVWFFVPSAERNLSGTDRDPFVIFVLLETSCGKAG